MNTTNETPAGISPAVGKTIAFALAGVGLLFLGTLVQPRFKSSKIVPEGQRVLFPELADASKAASLEMISYDDALATLHPFKVMQSDGVWVLPAHEKYPADAKEQLAAAATELVDLEALDMVSQSPGDHETFGVIEPDPEKLKPGMTGIGELVEIRDSAGTKLARLIVGKEDKRQGGASSAGGKKLRFVRKAGQDPVYRVEIDTSKFTKKFSDWIEKDLLKISPWDVRTIVLDDYSLGATESMGRMRVEQTRKSLIELAYNDKDSAWSLEKMQIFIKDKPQEEKLGENEELASTKLNDLRNALGDLKIIDVARKPAGLSADLKADESFTGDPEALSSLKSRGFLPLKSGDILSTDGETIIGMKDGVEYVLRFGTSTTVSGEADKASSENQKSDSIETQGRYLLVMSRFNESLLVKPTLDPVPDAPTESAPPADTESDKPDATKAPGAAKVTIPRYVLARLADDPSAADDEAPDASDEKAADAKSAEKKPDADEAEVKAQAAREEKRRVERENRRKQDEYDEKIKNAQKRVRELNGRFADWYYVVSDKEYEKIHLTRDSVIQKKAKVEPAGEADGTAPASPAPK